MWLARWYTIQSHGSCKSILHCLRRKWSLLDRGRGVIVDRGSWLCTCFGGGCDFHFATAAFSLSNRIWSFSAKASHRARRESGSSAQLQCRAVWCDLRQQYCGIARVDVRCVVGARAAIWLACRGKRGGSHSSLTILVRSLFVASGKSPCTPSFIALLKNINAVVGFRTLRALRAGLLMVA